MSYSVNLQLIRQLRLENNLTMEEMANHLGLKSKSDYFKRENGDTNFKSTELPILATVLHEPVDSFFKKNVSKIETN